MEWLFDKIFWLVEGLIGIVFDVLEWIVGLLPTWDFAEVAAVKTGVELLNKFDRFVPFGTIASAVGVYLAVYVLVRTWRPLLRLFLGSRSPV